MISIPYIARYTREFRLSYKTVLWLQRQQDAGKAIDKLVADSEESFFLAANIPSAAEEEIEICREQIDTLKQMLEYQTQISEEYLKEAQASKEELEVHNQELRAYALTIIKLKENLSMAVSPINSASVLT